MDEKLLHVAPGRLAHLLREGLRGHHLLFDQAEIRAAFAAPDEQVSRDQANAIGDALLTICKEPLNSARGTVDALPEKARVALIRLWFRLLDRAGAEAQPRH